MALKAGVIGLRMGAAHVAGYAAHPDVEVTAVCDTDAERAQAVAAEHDVPTWTADYQELLAGDVDIVSVATPDRVHPEHCVAALKAGKHVLCEKPLALTYDGLRDIVQAARQAPGKFMVGQVCRYAPGFVEAKRLIDEGVIGRVFQVESEYAHNYEKARGVDDWRVDPLRHPFVGGGCHAVDLLRWIAGDIEECHAYANHFALPDWPVDDCVQAHFKFESGVIGRVMCSIGCRRPYTMRSCFYGDAGTIIADNKSPEIQVCSTQYPASDEFTAVSVDVDSHNVTSEIAEFVTCILKDEPVSADAREGARTVAACLAVVESAATGLPVKIRNHVWDEWGEPQE